jgi:hypothetical protein
MSKSFHEQLAEAEELVVDTAGIVFHQRQRTLARPVLSQAWSEAMRRLQFRGKDPTVRAARRATTHN